MVVFGPGDRLNYFGAEVWKSGLLSSRPRVEIIVLEQQLIDEFASRLRGEISERLVEMDADSPHASDVALADVVLGYIEEAGLVTEHELCPYEDSTGRKRCRFTGYALPEDSTRLEIFTAEFVSEDDGPYLDTGALSRLAGRAARFFGYIAEHDLERRPFRLNRGGFPNRG